MKRPVALPKPLPLLESDRAADRMSGSWRAYLLLAVALAPVVVPPLPGNSALLDAVNLVALAGFAFALVAPGRRLHLPLVLPMGLIAVGSVLATLGAPSPQKAVLAVGQDVYLFVWFVALVNLLRGQRDVRFACLVWMAAAVVVSGIALGQLWARYGTLETLLGSRGLRPTSTFANPNVLADYLVMSLFLSTSLQGQVRRRILWPAQAFILLGVLATKSNGGILSLAAGGAVWLLVTIAVSPVRRSRLVAGTLLVAGLAGLGLWANREWGVGESVLSSLQAHTFAGRMEHSSQSRMRIWDQLDRAYQRNPLGIGPGNSSSLTLSLTDRERPDSYQSKEAHSDYLAYAIERGPIGLAGLLVMTAALFAQVHATWRDGPQRGERQRQSGRWVAAVTAALASSAAHSMVIEKLHFRHYWLLLALVSASALYAARLAERRRVRLAALSPESTGDRELASLRPARPGTRRRRVLRPAGLLRRVTA